MFKKTFTICSFVITMMALLSLTGKPNNNGNTPSQKNVIKTVIIDAGHGGIDPGTVGQMSREKDVALAIALKLGKQMMDEFPNIKIIFTRTEDILPNNLKNKDLANRYRAELANKSKGDLFISIHCDAAGKKAGGWYEKRIVGYRPKVVYTGRGKRRRKKTIQEPQYETYYVKNNIHGPSTYIWASDRSGAKSSTINPEEGEGGEIGDSSILLDLASPEARLRAQLYEKYYFRNSYTVGRYIQDEFKAAGRNDKGVLQRNWAGIWVLQATGMPSILIETGYLSNTEEEKYLNSTEGQNEVVANIITGFRKYKKEIEGSKAGAAVAIPSSSKK
jgi:N-acetylmuramoyl-L-alanine amidase